MASGLPPSACAAKDGRALDAPAGLTALAGRDVGVCLEPGERLFRFGLFGQSTGLNCVQEVVTRFAEVSLGVGDLVEHALGDAALVGTQLVERQLADGVSRVVVLLGAERRECKVDRLTDAGAHLT